MTDEEFVRAHWANIREEIQRCVKEAPINWHGYVIAVKDSGEELLGSGNRKDRWFAAAAFTRERLEQIRQVKEEIEQMQDVISFTVAESDDCSELPESWRPAFGRILAREQAALAELKRGMKDQGRV